MKKLTLLKRLIDLVYLCYLTAAVFLIWLLPDLFTGAVSLPIKILILCLLIAGSFYVYSVYLLRETIGFFKDRDVFNVTVIKNFNTIGKCLIAAPLMGNAALLVFYMTNGNSFAGIKLDFSYQSLALSIFGGLFFMVLSEAFKAAKEMKEENELTV